MATRKLTSQTPRNTYVVLGAAGNQGRAIVYDLIRHGAAKKIILCDINHKALQAQANEMALLNNRAAIIPQYLEVQQASDISRHVPKGSVVINALSYKLNRIATDAALLAEAHYCDLGMDPAVTQYQYQKSKEAAKKRITLLPELGVAPGLNTFLAGMGKSCFRKTRHIFIYCGGLPQRPIPPFGWLPTWSPRAALLEYSQPSLMLQRGRLIKVKALAGSEEIAFDAFPHLKFEAAYTGGNLAHAARSLQPHLDTLLYRTVRFADTDECPGHFTVMRGFGELGFLDDKTARGEARLATLLEAMDEKLKALRGEPDMILLRVDCWDKEQRDGNRFEIVHKAANGFSAMQQMTGFPTGLMARALADGLFPRGTVAIEKVPLEHPALAQVLLEGLGERGINLKHLQLPHTV